MCGFLDDICSVKPDLSMLSKFKMQLCPDWFYIGLTLGISAEYLNEINLGKHRPRDKCFYMFERWLQLDCVPCYCKLIFAVKDEGNCTLAEDIQCKIEHSIGEYVGKVFHSIKCMHTFTSGVKL